MKKLILVVHVSLDGFVAGPNGELDGFPSGEENLAFVCKITETADTALFGRISYELLNGYWPTAAAGSNATPGEIAYSNWYNSAKKIILSNSMAGIEIDNTTIVSENMAIEIMKLKAAAGKDILVFGSPATAQSLMQEDLIDNYWIFINPVIFGKGIPLFARLEDKTRLTLLATQKFSNGEIAIQYAVNRH